MQRPLLTETSFDTVVIGTGLTESIVATACSRIKKKVLVFDPNEFYGSQFSTPHLKEFEETYYSGSARKSTFVDDKSQSKNFESIKILKNTIIEDKTLSIPQNKKRWYYFDMLNKFIFCGSELVTLLISSGIGKYMEFRCLNGMVIFVNGKFEKVPVTKGEIFSNKFLSLKEKRFLMKFIKDIMKEQDENMNEDPKLFREYIKTRKLTPKLRKFILYSMAFCDNENTTMTTMAGKKRIRLFLNSFGRFGSCCFLYPLYGISELPQSFCRASAVFGGIFVLGRTAKKLEVNEEKNVLTSIECTRGQRITCKNLILNNSFTFNNEKFGNFIKIYRVITVTNFHIINPGIFKEDYRKSSLLYEYGAVLGIIPPNEINTTNLSELNKNVIHFTQLDHTSKMSPKGKYVIIFQTKADNDEEGMKILEGCVEKYLKIQIKEDEIRFQNAVKKKKEIEEKFKKEIEEQMKKREEMKKEKEKKKEEEVEVEKKEEEEGEKKDGEDKKENEVTVKKDEKEEEEEEPFKDMPKIIINPKKVISYQVFYRKLLRKGKSKLDNISNVFFCSDIDETVHLENSVLEAKKIFESIYPNEEFIPKMPMHEEKRDETAQLLGIDEKEIQKAIKEEVEKEKENSKENSKEKEEKEEESEKDNEEKLKK